MYQEQHLYRCYGRSELSGCCGRAIRQVFDMVFIRLAAPPRVVFVDALTSGGKVGRRDGRNLVSSRLVSSRLVSSRLDVGTDRGDKER